MIHGTREKSDEERIEHSKNNCTGKKQGEGSHKEVPAVPEKTPHTYTLYSNTHPQSIAGVLRCSGKFHHGECGIHRGRFQTGTFPQLRNRLWHAGECPEHHPLSGTLGEVQSLLG